MAQIAEFEPQRRARKGDAEFMAALALGMTMTDAAQAAGISRSTAYRRVAEEGFATALNDAKAEIVDQTVAQVVAGCNEAISEMRDLVKNAPSQSVRLAAARALINAGMKVVSAQANSNAPIGVDEDAGGEKVVTLAWSEVSKMAEGK